MNMKLKNDLPKLPDGEIDLSKVDISNDFIHFPPLYQTPEDIAKFIQDNNCDFPIIMELLNRRKNNKLDITPAEDKFYFDNLFSYVYDVFRIPVPETTEQMISWLEYISDSLLETGFNQTKKDSFESAGRSFDMMKRQDEFFKNYDGKLSKKARKSVLVDINYHTEILTDDPEYYNGNPEKVVEQFWIKSDRHRQPVIVGDEAYMRVWVYDDHVYIFGCDDMSWSFNSSKPEELADFVKYLKQAAPVWNFCFPKLINKELYKLD
jgi:hypothetical protein